MERESLYRALSVRGNRLSESDIIGNKQVDSRKLKRFPQGLKLISVEANAGPER